MFWNKIKTPDKVDLDLLAGGRDGTAFTPDLWKLEQHEYQLLFVHDQFMSRHPLHNVISPYIYRGKPIAPGFTAESFWGFWKYKLGEASFPIAMVNRNRSETFLNKIGRIRGEVVAIRPYMFLDLDKYYQNRVEFIRYRTNIIVPNRKLKTNTAIGDLMSDEYTETLRCWMYIGKPSLWLDMLDGGQNFCPVRTHEQLPKKGMWYAGKYFYWTLNEYNDQPSDYPIVENIPHKQITFTVRNVSEDN